MIKKPTSLRPKSLNTLTLEQVNEQLKNLNIRRTIHIKTLALIEKVKDGIESPLWLHVKEKCVGLIRGEESLQDRADEYKPEAHPIPDRTLWRASGLKKAAKLILGIEDVVNNEEAYRTSLADIEKELKELGQRKQQLSAGA